MVVLKVFLSLFLVFAWAVEDSNAQEAMKKRKGQAIPGKEQPHPPKVGQEAPTFSLKSPNGDVVELHKLTASSPVVLLVLRGWPEYQCPICSRQMGQFFSKKAEFEKLGAHVVMIYPGPADKLAEHAKEFQGNQKFSDNFHFLIDPEYKFTNAWGLRWEAPRETAYPSTFIVGKDNKIKYGVTSVSHGDRSDAATVLGELAKL